MHIFTFLCLFALQWDYSSFWNPYQIWALLFSSLKSIRNQINFFIKLFENVCGHKISAKFDNEPDAWVQSCSNEAMHIFCFCPFALQWDYSAFWNPYQIWALQLSEINIKPNSYFFPPTVFILKIFTNFEVFDRLWVIALYSVNIIHFTFVRSLTWIFFIGSSPNLPKLLIGIQSWSSLISS